MGGVEAVAVKAQGNGRRGCWTLDCLYFIKMVQVFSPTYIGSCSNFE